MPMRIILLALYQAIASWHYIHTLHGKDNSIWSIAYSPDVESLRPEGAEILANSS